MAVTLHGAMAGGNILRPDVPPVCDWSTVKYKGKVGERALLDACGHGAHLCTIDP